MCVCVWRGVCTRGWWEGVGLYVCVCVEGCVYSWVVGGGRSVCVCVCGGVCTRGWWEGVGLYVCVCVEGCVLVGGGRG